MGDSVREQMTIAAPVAEVMDVLLAIERYPEWARDLKAADVLARDDEGRVTEARFRAAGFGYSTEYTLAYDHSVPGRLAWVLTEGDVTRKLDGHYELPRRPATAAPTWSTSWRPSWCCRCPGS